MTAATETVTVMHRPGGGRWKKAATVSSYAEAVCLINPRGDWWLMRGVRTNVVTGVEISDHHDSQMLPSLTATTAQNFPVREVSADKAYLSREFVEDLGAVPYIPFKVNSVEGKRADIWQRMFCEFMLNKEEWLKHYHQRSNVESTFSMVKRKFGDAVRSKTEIAMKNEVLAKVLCHNLCCLIHAMYELGIDPKLTEPGAVPTILKFTAG